MHPQHDDLEYDWYSGLWDLPTAWFVYNDGYVCVITFMGLGLL